MPHRDALARLNQSLAAIDVMIRSGKGQGGRLVEVAREARAAAKTLDACIIPVHSPVVAQDVPIPEKV
ncbi:MAG: hypothetical protein Q8O26_00325 [Phreatobacter sp.]|uniref:hypothetical protein n=1 Tax=Phreatobacter sp. TaxID=1966341 RepID=UPI002734858C|nr:hypothetical protein [Phreatobacter sp.]MDP2800308.1 hypothetical protein [Phreatobacter sp.]